MIRQSHVAACWSDTAELFALCGPCGPFAHEDKITVYMIHRYLTKLRNVAAERFPWLQPLRRKHGKQLSEEEQMERDASMAPDLRAWVSETMSKEAFKAELKRVEQKSNLNYLEERRRLTAYLPDPEKKVSFKGKKQVIREQYRAYHNVTEPSHVNYKWDKNVFATSSSCRVIGNRNSFDVAQYLVDTKKASMSFIHLLAVPEKYIYNGVSLTKDDVDILLEMVDLFKQNWAQHHKRVEILNYQKTAIENQLVASLKEIDEKEEEDARTYPELREQALAAQRVALKHWKELAPKVHNINVDDFRYGLHLHPDHSIHYLHLHIIAAPEEFRKYSTTAHDLKTKDASEVRDVILLEAALDSQAQGPNVIKRGSLV